jgi:surfactin synthase thioesterase subunit
MRKVLLLSVLAFAVFRLVPSPGQSPEPVVIQAISPVPAGAAVPARSSASADSETMVQLLQEMQATNAATLKKQEAALESLDALQKAAEEIKIYSKRG